MNKLSRIFALCFMSYALFGAARAVSFQQHPPLLSTTGLITNVQSYSSNPFHNPNSPYNQRFPVPIFAPGAELNAGDCINIVQGIVFNECRRRNNCAGLRVADVRPAAMQQLAAIPGANYVVACAGFIDGVFDEVVKNANVVSPSAFPSAFPAAVGGGGGTAFPLAGGGNRLVVNNPLAIRDPAWYTEYYDRSHELAALRAQTAPDTRLVATAFPAHFDDLSFVERQQILREGMAPFRDATAYRTINIETDEAAAQRRAREMRAEVQEMQARAQLEVERCNMLRYTDLDEWRRRCQGRDDCPDRLTAIKQEAMQAGLDVTAITREQGYRRLGNNCELQIEYFRTRITERGGGVDAGGPVFRANQGEASPGRFDAFLNALRGAQR